MKTRSGLLLNSLSQAGVRLLGSACALFLTWLIARRSVDDLGVFRTLFVYFLISEFVPLLGMQTFLFREISLHPDQIKKYTLHAFVFSQVVAGGAILALCGLSWWGHYSPEISRGLFVVAAGLPATAASLVGLSILVGAGQATRFSLVQGLETLLRTAVGIACILRGWGVLSVILAITATRWVTLYGYWRSVQPLFQGESWCFDRGFFREFMSHVPTFAGITTLSLISRFATQAMLPWMLNDASAGQFAAAYMFIDLALLVPTALTTNLMPVLARKARESTAALGESCHQGIKIMVTGVLPISAIVAAIARPMFAAVLPGKASYAVSAQVLEVVIWTCSLQAVDQVLAAAIVARGRADVDLRTVAIGAGSLIVLLIALIPRYGVRGAALGVLAALGVALTARFILVGKHIPDLRPFEAFWRPALSAGAAAVLTFTLAPWNWLAAALLGAASYLSLLGIVGGFARAEREGVLRLLQAGRA